MNKIEEIKKAATKWAELHGTSYFDGVRIEAFIAGTKWAQSEFGLVSREESDKLAEALRELVQVKEWKDKHGKDEHYCKAQPIAWSNAQQTLTEYEKLK